MSFYAVKINDEISIYDNWKECSKNVKGYSNAKYKKFNSRDAAEKYFKDTFVTDDIIDYCVYTDGACSNNGNNDSVAGYGIYFGENDSRNKFKKLEGYQTNNTAELTAVIDTYDLIKNDLENGKNIQIMTDSAYVMFCVNEYGKQHAENGWKNNFPNKILVKECYERYNKHKNVFFKHIKAHTSSKDIHSIGNYHADRLANEAIRVKSCPYNTTRIYIDVEYKKKEVVKLFGGIWDSNIKKWYIHENNKYKDDVLNIFKVIKVYENN